MTGTIIPAVAILAAIIYAWWSNRTPPDKGVPKMPNPPPPPRQRPSSEIRGFVRPQRPPSKPDKVL